VWNYYTWCAAVPTDHWVWNEGGPQAYRRSWNAGRTFSALASRVTVEAELEAADVAARLDRMRRG
jgi:hypothetical protein